MKKLLIIIPILSFMLFSCGETDPPQEESITELSTNHSVSGTISSKGEVDWYHYRAVEANNVLKISCSSNTYRPDVDLLVGVYREDEDGERVRVYADHAPEESQLPADINMYVYIDQPKDLYISVRDLLDNEASDNPYFLSVDFATASGENENFEQATAITVDNAQSCQTDTIGSIGDVDSYKFTAAANGVYAIQVDFSPFDGSPVKLTADLYDSTGILVQSLSGESTTQQLRPYLTAGEYFVLIYESGRDDFDNSSPFTVCVNTVTADEINENDLPANASAISYASPMEITGSLEYLNDKDWYQIPLPAGAGIKVMNLTLSVPDIDFDYQVSMLDSAQTVLLTHRHAGGSSNYLTQIKAGTDEPHFLMIEAAAGQTISSAASYSASIQVVTISDPDDEANLGNDITTAVELTKDTFTSDTYIGYRGDVDWYQITVPAKTPTAAPQVLELFIDNAGASAVEYYASIIRDDVVKKTYDLNGGDGATDLKMSVLVPASAEDIIYYFRVCDYQNDEGDPAIPYRVKADYGDIPDDKSLLPADALRDAPTTQYYGEIGELTEPASLTLQHSSVRETAYLVNDSLLDFHAEPLPAGITATTEPDATVTIEFPWVAGYIDYQRDMDFFQVDLRPFDDTDTEWYYDIIVELHTGGAGSAVEYIWEFYRDSNQDQIIVDRPSSASCVFASNGDTTPAAIAAFDITTPTGGDEFWVGDGWADDSPLFYIGISDFDYIGASPDDDWAHDVPYYFRLTLVYHPGVSQPE